MPLQRLAFLLAMAGTLPFFLGLLLLVAGWPLQQFSGAMLSHTYGVVIVSFLAGIQWGVYLFAQGHLNLFIASNLIALLAWFSLLLAGRFIGFLLLDVCFIAALVVDWYCHRDGIISKWFWTLRWQVSAIVIPLIGLTALATF